jgi:thymidylate synthase (FAD)
MKIIKPSFSILSPIDGDMLKNIERAGRTCYKSEDKITDDSAAEFVRMLIRKGHESVLEHEKISVLFVCDRGVSHELVRHRIASFSQESTRYCNYGADQFGGVTFVVPPWVGIESGEIPIEWDGLYGTTETGRDPSHYATDRWWFWSMATAERDYLKLLELGWTPQQARSVLPNSLKTEIVVTANLREWRTILKQRTSPAAHPQMRELMCPLLNELKSLLPVVFDDISH